ncbi:MAG TPA: transporter substrate-binding domain-containing protein, partial [Solirubrobacteraceae bacterium]|nr:transporter substrate-binding domain-containing protein [Solirubrobacteraceae bacterium]
MRRLGGWVIPVLAVLAVAGCGSSKSSSTTSSTSSSPSVSANAAVTAQVPAKYKAKRTLDIGMEAQYAPNEFLAPDGHTIIGMDADLITAIANAMGLNVNLVNANFEAIIPGIQAGRYDLG